MRFAHHELWRSAWAQPLRCLFYREHMQLVYAVDGPVCSLAPGQLASLPPELYHTVEVQYNITGRQASVRSLLNRADYSAGVELLTWRTDDSFPTRFVVCRPR